MKKLVMLFSCLLATGCCSDGRPVSVVLVTIDTLRADHVGCYGYRRVRTPILDSLSLEGVLFENAVSQMPLTAPSHATILTSTYPQDHGVLDNTTSLPHDVPSIAEVLASRGYVTAAIVSGYPLKARTCGLDRGFATYVDDFPADTLRGKASKVGRRVAGATTDRALAWLSGRRGEAYFLWIHYFDPHEPYDPPAPFDTMFTAGLMEPVAQSEEREYKMALYDGAISYTDRELGRLLRRLGADGERSQHLVIVTADHGESFEHGYLFDHAARLYESLVRVPLIMCGPGLPRGMRVPVQVSLVDVAPTILDAIDIPQEKGRAGRSLLPLLAPDVASGQPHVFALTPLRSYPHLIEPLAMVRAQNRKLILGLRTGSRELYCLEQDPDELHNLAGDGGGDVAALELRLRTWLDQHPARKVPQAVLEQHDREVLRALGYLE
jgi:arylsulfatase A-like enzyme